MRTICSCGRISRHKGNMCDRCKMRGKASTLCHKTVIDMRKELEKRLLKNHLNKDNIEVIK